MVSLSYSVPICLGKLKWLPQHTVLDFLERNQMQEFLFYIYFRK